MSKPQFALPKTSSPPKSAETKGIVERIADKLLRSKCSRVAIIVAIISLIGGVLVAIVSQGVFNPAINNFLYPKHAVVETNFIMPYNSTYDYCVVFDSQNEYSIKVTTDGTPINMHVVPDSDYLRYSPVKTKDSEQWIIHGDYPYSPSTPGRYRIVIENSLGGLFPQYMNKSVLVNLTIEANRICAT